MTITRAGVGPARTTGRGVPPNPWSASSPTVEERMLTLTWRVTNQVGWPRRATDRLCRRIFGGVPSVRNTVALTPASGQADPGRRTRANLLRTLRTELGSRVDSAGLERALQDAITLDELTLLPPRQRFAVWSATVHRRTVGQIAHQAGWTPTQVSRLLRTGLHTITLYAHG